jgi:hypothetical protein
MNIIHSSVDEHLGCFNPLAIVNNTPENSMEFIARSGIYMGILFLILLINLHTEFHSVCTILCPTKSP